MENYQLSADIKIRVKRFVDKHPAVLSADGETVPMLSPFWDYYRENKTILRQQGLFVFKSADGSWRVRWTDPAEKQQAIERKIDTWLARLSACGCVDYFDDMLVIKRTLKNGSVRYDWRCSVCRRTARNDGQDSEALPHVLIPVLEARGCRVVEVP